MATYKFIQHLNTRQALITKNREFFVASFSDVPFSGPEVLVFPANRDGKITDWGEVDGGRGYKSLSEFLHENVTLS